MKRYLSYIILLFLLVPFVSSFTACNGGNNPDVKIDNDYGTYDEPPTIIKMFMGDAGILVPEDIEVDNNKYINLIKQKFNVDIIIDKPDYQDFQLKYYLLLASQDLPDIIHTSYNYKVDEYGKKGFFLPLNDFIEKSEVINRLFDQVSIYAATADDGNIYGIPQLRGRKVGINSCVARTDLLDEINGGVVPLTPDEWFDVMAKLKSKYPDSIPFTARSDLAYGTLFFGAFGVIPNYNEAPYFSIESDGSVVTNFEKPEYKKAISFYKKLYDNGLMDSNFADNDSNDRRDAVFYKKTICFNTSPTDILHYLMPTRTTDENAMFEYVSSPSEPGIPAVNTLNHKQLLINSHRVSVSSSSKHQDKALEIIEYMASPEWRGIVFWGFEDDGYTIREGKRVIDIENYDRENYRRIYAFILGYTAEPEAVNASIVSQFGYDTFNKAYSSINIANSEGEKRGYYPFELKPFIKGSDERERDAYNFIIKTSIEAITGQISMEQ